MSTFAAIILGTSLGGELFERWHDEPWRLGVGARRHRAWSGALTSFGIPHVPAAEPGQRVRLESLRRDRPRPRAPLSRPHALDHRRSASRTSGCSARSCSRCCFPWGRDVVRRRRSGRDAPLHVPGDRHRRRQPGRRPSVRRQGRARPGAARLDRPRASSACCSCRPCRTTGSPPLVLVLLGFSGGFFAVPLNALLQQRPADDEKGRVLATNNVLNTVGMLLGGRSSSGCSATGCT